MARERFLDWIFEGRNLNARGIGLVALALIGTYSVFAYFVNSKLSIITPDQTSLSTPVLVSETPVTKSIATLTPKPPVIDFRQYLDCQPINGNDSAWTTAERGFGDPNIMEEQPYVVLNKDGTYRAIIIPSEWSVNDQSANAQAARETAPEMSVCINR